MRIFQILAVAALIGCGGDKGGDSGGTTTGGTATGGTATGGTATGGTATGGTATGGTATGGTATGGTATGGTATGGTATGGTATGGTATGGTATGGTATGGTATGGTPDSFSLTLQGSGYAPHDGQTVAIAVVDMATGELIQNTSVVMDASGMLDVTLEGAMMPGMDYVVQWYADLNGSGDCSAPPADHSWHEMVLAASMDTVIVRDHDLEWVDVCATWGAERSTVSLSGSGYQPHDGQEVHAVLADTATGTTVARAMQVMDSSGELMLDFGPVGVSGGSYRVSWFADLSGNGSCDAPPRDHSWRLPVGPISGDFEAMYDHDTDFSDVCDAF